jgi:hypothetical protein
MTREEMTEETTHSGLKKGVVKAGSIKTVAIKANETPTRDEILEIKGRSVGRRGVDTTKEIGLGLGKMGHLVIAEPLKGDSTWSIFIS